MDGESGKLSFFDLSDSPFSSADDVHLECQFPVPRSFYQKLIDDIKSSSGFGVTCRGGITAELFRDEVDESLNEGFPIRYGLLVRDEEQETYATTPARLDRLLIQKDLGVK